MRKLVVLLSICCFCFNVFAEHNSTVLKNNKWYIGTEKPASINDLKNSISNFFTPEDSIFPQINQGNLVLSTIIELPTLPEGKLVLSIEKGNLLFDVWIDGKKKENPQNNENFLSELDYQIEKGDILLTLIQKNGQKIDKESLRSLLQNITVTSLTGIVISWITTQKDAYFGCPMLEIHILNTLGKDIDGKIIARILNPETLELIAENNNCAFSKSKTEIVIGVIFPGTELILKKGKYIAEVMMVDKENNEEVVDQLSVPIQLE